MTVTSTDGQMSRIADAFSRVKAEGRTGLVTYLTAGDPSLARTSELLFALARAGGVGPEEGEEVGAAGPRP